MGDSTKPLKRIKLEILSILCRILSVKRTYQPKVRKRARAHGFLSRMATKGGQQLVKRRRQKGRVRLGV